MRIGIGNVNTAVVSPDASKIAVGTSTGIYMFDAETLTQIWRKYTDSPVMGINWSPDGKQIVLADYWDGYVEPAVWDAESGQKIATLAGAWLNGTWSPNGEWIAAFIRPEYLAVEGGGIELPTRLAIYYPTTGQAYRIFTIDNAYHLNNVTWSLDGSLLALRDDSINFIDSPDTYIVNSVTGAVLEQLPRGSRYGDRFPLGNWTPDFGEALSPDGRLFLRWVDGGYEIRITTNSGAKFVEFDDYPVTRGASTFDWYPDGTRFVIAAESGLTIVSLNSGEVVSGFSTLSDIEAVSWLPDNDTVLVQTQHVQQAWSVATGTLIGNQFEPLSSMDGQSEALSPDGTLLAVSEDVKGPYADGVIVGGPVNMESGRLLVVDNATKQQLWERNFVGQAVGGMAWSTDGALLALGSQRTRSSIATFGVTGLEKQEVLVVNALTGEIVFTFAGHSGNTFALAFSPDGTKLASASADGTVIVWPINY